MIYKPKFRALTPYKKILSNNMHIPPSGIVASKIQPSYLCNRTHIPNIFKLANMVHIQNETQDRQCSPLPINRKNNTTLQDSSMQTSNVVYNAPLKYEPVTNYKRIR